MRGTAANAREDVSRKCNGKAREGASMQENDGEYASRREKGGKVK
jgi:hypothetical protein